MKRISILITILAGLGLLLSACSPAAASNSSASATLPAPAATASTCTSSCGATPSGGAAQGSAITLTDGLGRAVALDKPAQKIVSLAPSNTEILFAIGAGKQVIGRDEFSNVPEEAKSLPSVGGNMGKYDLEAITKLQPDLVLAAEINTPEQVKAMEDLGLKVFYLSNPKDFNGMYQNLETVAKLAGREQETAALVDSLKKRVEVVTSKTAGVTAKPKVFYELDGSDPAKPWTTGPGTFMDQMLAMAGGQNAAHGMSQSWGQISQEELLVQNPDIILLGDAAYGITADQLAKRPGWNAIQAVKDNKIYTFDDNLVSRPGPRLVDGLELIAKILHPELF